MIEMTKLQELGFHTTPDGLVVAQSDGDLGDGPQRTSFAHLAFIMTNDLSEARKFDYAYAFHWLNKEGELVRDIIQWNDPKDLSRDQLDPLNIVYSLYFNRPLKLYWFKYPNKDIGGPQTWALNIRTQKHLLLYPILPILDLQILGSVLLTCLDHNLDHVDDDNLIARVCQAILVMPTPITWLARKIYSKFRIPNIMQALARKHRLEAGGNPAFVTLWQPIIEKWFT